MRAILDYMHMKLLLYSSYLLNMPNLCRLNEKKRSVYTIHIYKPHFEHQFNLSVAATVSLI